MPTWIQLHSSAISAAAYQGNSLYIRFITGNEYEYYHAPKRIYEELTKASSKGKYFNDKIKEHYRYRKIS